MIHTVWIGELDPRPRLAAHATLRRGNSRAPRAWHAVSLTIFHPSVRRPLNSRSSLVLDAITTEHIAAEIRKSEGVRHGFMCISTIVLVSTSFNQHDFKRSSAAIKPVQTLKLALVFPLIIIPVPRFRVIIDNQTRQHDAARTTAFSVSST